MAYFALDSRAAHAAHHQNPSNPRAVVEPQMQRRQSVKPLSATMHPLEVHFGRCPPPHVETQPRTQQHSNLASVTSVESSYWLDYQGPFGCRFAPPQLLLAMKPPERTAHEHPSTALSWLGPAASQGGLFSGHSRSPGIVISPIC